MARWVERDCVARAISGDAAALDDAVARVWPACFRLAATVIGDRALAEDAAQEACMIVYRKLGSLRAADAFDAWMYRIVMREAARARKRRAFVAYEPREYGASHDGTLAIDVWSALRALSAELRDVAVLFYFDDLPTHEIAAILRAPHATIRTRLMRAREYLRGLLADYSNDALSRLQEVRDNAL